MKDKKVVNIIKYNIKKNIKNKWFIILNIIFFIVCTLAINFSEINKFIDNYNDEKVIEVVDTKGIMYKNLLNKFSDNEKIKIKRIDKLIYKKDNLENDRILIEVNYTKEKIIDIKIISTKLVEEETYFNIKEAVKKTRNEIFANRNNISKQNMNRILEKANIETIIVEESNYSSEKYMIYFIIFSILYGAVLLVLAKFSKEMFAEKTSKSSEYILTSINEKEYMITKIGTALINILIQGIAILIYFILGCVLKLFLTGDSIFSIVNLNTEIIKLIFIEFILYVPYMTIMLTIQMLMSSKASDSSSSSSTEMISTFITMITIMIPFFMVGNEVITTGFVYYFLAVIPLFSTFLIPPLLIFYNVGIVHTIIAILLYIIIIAIMLKITPQKIKNSILDYKQLKNNKTKENLNNKKIKDKIKFELERKLYIEKMSKYSMIIGLSIVIFLVLTIFILPLIIDPIMQAILEGKVRQENISLISSIISGILSLYIPKKFLDIYDKKEISVQKDSKLKWFLIAIPFVVLIFGLQTWIIKKMGINSITNTIENTSYLLVFLRLVIVPAIFEELLFRKAIFNISKKNGIVFAVIMSSILFGIIHLNIYQAIGAGLAGIVFAILVYKTGSLMPSIILHAMVNGYSFFTNTLWINNPGATKLLNIFVIGFMIIGIVILLENLLKSKKKIKDSIKKIGKEKISQSIINVSLLFSNYYFVFSIILIVISFTLTQKYIGMLL